MGGLFEAEVKLLGNEQEVIIVNFGVVGLFVHGFEEDGFDFEEFLVLSGEGGTVWSVIQT